MQVKLDEKPNVNKNALDGSEQLDKPGLLKVTIRGKSLANLFMGHHYETDTVGQSPIFVMAMLIECPAF
jgi:hypothetical protein